MILLIGSCGRDSEDFRIEAIETATNLLNDRKCQEAIELLEEVGRDTENLKYMKTLALSYACRANYSTPTFFTDDLPNIASSGSILGSFATFNNASTMNAYDHDGYDDMQTAIDILLYLGGMDTAKDPTLERRALVLDSDVAADINSLLTFLILDQMGRFFYHYGDASTAGVKGGRDSGGNECLVNYDQTRTTTNAIPDLGVGAGITMSAVLTGFAALAGECDGNVTDDDVDGDTDEGHPDFGVSGSLNTKRLCQGMVLYNNFRVLLPELVSNTTSGDLSSLDNVSAFLETQVGYLETGIPLAKSYVTNTLSQTKCEADNTNAGTSEYLEWFYAMIFEPLFL